MQESHEIFKKVVNIEGVSFTAHETNISQGKLYNWMAGKSSPSYSMNPIEQILAITQCSGDKELIKHLCNSVGGYYVDNPEKVKSELEILDKINKVMRRFTMAMDVITRSVHDDGCISPSEAEEIELEWNRLKTVGQTLVDCAKAGKYDGHNR